MLGSQRLCLACVPQDVGHLGAVFGVAERGDHPESAVHVATAKPTMEAM